MDQLRPLAQPCNDFSHPRRRLEVSDVSEEQSKASPFIWVIISGSPDPTQTALGLVRRLSAQARGSRVADSLQHAGRILHTDTPENYPQQSPQNPLASNCRIGLKSTSSSLTHTRKCFLKSMSTGRCYVLV